LRRGEKSLVFEGDPFIMFRGKNPLEELKTPGALEGFSSSKKRSFTRGYKHPRGF